MSLESLNLAEQQLCSRVQQVTGLMEEKHEQLQQSGAFRKYSQIYEAYVDLIDSESEGLEALKRATFLMWYEQAEPACFSAVFGLSAAANRKVLEAFDRRIAAVGLDIELKWMLPYYNLIADWVFSQAADLPYLQSFLADADAEMWRKIEIEAGNFTNRGQMGDYWSSIINSTATSFRKATS